MSYQLPPLSDEYQFERLIRDILRRECDDAGVEIFGRRGQAQFGIDGYVPTKSGATFQCKLKDVRFKDDNQLRGVLLTEMAEELEKTKGLATQPTRFIFASTFKNDALLQEKADSLSAEFITVEYWGWDTISEKIRQYAEYLFPIYYPQFPIRRISALVQITPELITSYQTNDVAEINKLAIEYYRINDRSEIVLRVVCNNIDVRNENVMNYTFGRLKSLPPSATLWILGDGGSGKTTTLNRLAVELTGRGRNVYMLNLETHTSKDDLEKILLWLKFSATSDPTVLCIDNPAADEAILETLLRQIPDYCPEIHILLAERDHRYRALKRTGCLTYLQGEEEHEPVSVHNSPDQRQKVYHRLFDLLGISDDDRKPLLHIALNERLVYVNATYSILLELRRQRKIIFDFDWDDYRKMTDDLPAFRESYKYIALFYLFGVKTPFTVLSKLFGADETERQTFLERFRGLINEPVILDERRDYSFRKSVYVRTKHEIVSEIFFREHPELNKDDLLMEWCERTDFEDALEAQALVNIFGAKKNYTDENPYINFSELIDFLLKGYLHKKIVLSPKLNATLHTAKFWLLKMLKKSDEAVKVLEKFVESAPDDLHSRTELAKIYINDDRLDDAETVLLKILELKADDLNSRIELAKVYQKQNRLTEAETVLSELLAIENRSIRANTELAKIYQRQNKLAEAESVLLDVLDVRPKDLQSRTELAKIYQRQGKLVEAETVLVEILDIKPKDLQSRTELAKIYQRQGKLVEAETVLVELLEIDTNNLPARTELAKIYQRQNKLEEAIQRLKEYLDLNPQGYQRLYPRTELAKIYQRQGKLVEAETVLVELLEIDTNNLPARTELAKIYQRQGKLVEAETVLLESLEIDFQQVHPRTELARIYQRQNKLHKAEAISLESLRINSKQLHPRIQLAKIYQRQGKLTDAIVRAEEVLTIDPLNNYAVSELLIIWTRQEEKEKCVQRFLEFIAQPDYLFNWFSQAPVFRFFQCCRAFNMKEYAEQVFERFKPELDERNFNYYMNNFK